MNKFTDKKSVFDALNKAGRAGLTFGINDECLKVVVPAIKQLRLDGNNIHQDFLNGTKQTPFGRRVKYTMEGAAV